MTSPPTVRCAAAISQQAATQDAVAEICAAVRTALGSTPDLSLLFVSPHHLRNTKVLVEQTQVELSPRCLLGCSAEAIVGPGREIERQPAIALWSAVLPQTQLEPMRLSYEPTPEGGTLVGWSENLPENWPRDATLLVLADPYTFPAELLVRRLSEDQPAVPIVGGMASAARQSGGNRLFSGSHITDRGAVAIYLHGGLRVRTVVSQGCRPIGTPFVITKAHENVICDLGGVPAYQRLKTVYDALATHERQMLQQGLHVGRVVNEYQDHFEQGDFLVRNVLGVDAEQGTIVVGDAVRAGQTVQFHVRDAETADADLRQLLARAKQGQLHAPCGALLFTCNGRGSRLFAQPDHDVAAIARVFGPSLPVAGFFAAGEIGPIGGTSFLHGFTASIAIFEPLTLE